MGIRFRVRPLNRRSATVELRVSDCVFLKFKSANMGSLSDFTAFGIVSLLMYSILRFAIGLGIVG